jgi:hypothetical protein
LAVLADRHGRGYGAADFGRLSGLRGHQRCQESTTTKRQGYVSIAHLCSSRAQNLRGNIPHMAV